MNKKTEVIEGIYGGVHDNNYLWKNIVLKLTVRQAYVFYYSLAYIEKNENSVAIAAFDLPDQTMVHKCLMDALLKEKNPKEVAEKIGASAHKILINDNDLLWIRIELRAALWLSHFVTKIESGGDELLLGILRSTSRLDFVNRLIKVLDIYGCSDKADRSLLIRLKIDDNVKDLYVNHSSAFNYYRGSYISTRIDDSTLNWLNKLPEDEIDLIIERLKEEELLVLYGVFVPIIKKDKVESIKASLDIQKHRYGNKKLDESMLRPYTDKNHGGPTKLTKAANETGDVKPTDKKKKDFASLSTDEIIDLLKKAYSSRKHRKVTSNTKNNRSLTLKKESHTILIALSKQFGATPKKVMEALIKKVNLKNEYELSEIDNSISGKRPFKKQLKLEEPIEPKECTEASEEALESVREVKPTTKAKTNSDINIETEVSKKEKPETRKTVIQEVRKQKSN